MPDLLPTTVITRVDDLLATKVDGETVLMHIEQGQYYGLARTANVIWELLQAPCTFEQLCQALSRRYAGPPEKIAADTQRFVQAMATESLVTLK